MLVNAQDYEEMRAFFANRLRPTFRETPAAVSFRVDIPFGMAPRKFSRDPDDDQFVRTGLPRARYLVSCDQDLLSIPPPPGLLVLSPADALENIDFRR